MTIQILHRYSNAVLFEHDGANLVGANLADANLDGANLDGANLDGANLRRANLDGANLADANLRRAYLDGANLAGAKLCRANLAGANLDGANLAGANLDGANLAGAYLAGAYLAGATLKNGEKLIGECPIFQVGPIGSRSDVLVAYITDQGLRLDAGCQRQITREAFDARLSQTHSGNQHEREYRAALALIDVHVEIWTPT